MSHTLVQLREAPLLWQLFALRLARFSTGELQNAVQKNIYNRKEEEGKRSETTQEITEYLHLLSTQVAMGHFITVSFNIVDRFTIDFRYWVKIVRPLIIYF